MLTMIVAPGHEVAAREALRAAGFMATRTLGRVARRRDVVVGDVDLEGRDARHRPGRGPDLGRVVGHGGQVVAEGGAHLGEPVTGELHAVAGVAGEADDDPVDRSRARGAGAGRFGSQGSTPRIRSECAGRPASDDRCLPFQRPVPALARLVPMNEEQLQKMREGAGFIAALDQSGGSTPKALKLYGIAEDS